MHKAKFDTFIYYRWTKSSQRNLSVPVSRTLAVKALSAVENDVAKIALDKEA